MSRMRQCSQKTFYSAANITWSMSADENLRNPTNKPIIRQHPEHGYTIIIHPDTPGNELYHSPRPCPNCGCYFFSSHDFNTHKPTCEERMWKQGKYGESICLAAKKPELARECQIRGTVRTGAYKIVLSSNKKWLVRKRL